MGRAPCCDKANVKKGPWSPEEDAKLKSYIEQQGTGGNWIALPQKIGLKRCGKSCRLRWLNYLRPNIKHGGFSEEEDNIICSLYISIGSRWSIIAAQLPGRTDNDIKNYWNTRLKKKLLGSKQRKSHLRGAGTHARGTTAQLMKQQETPKRPAMARITVNGSIEHQYVMNNTSLTDHQIVNPYVDDQASIRKLLVKLGGRFSDDFYHHQYQHDDQTPIINGVTNGNTDATHHVLPHVLHEFSDNNVLQYSNTVYDENPRPTQMLDGTEFFYNVMQGSSCTGGEDIGWGEMSSLLYSNGGASELLHNYDAVQREMNIMSTQDHHHCVFGESSFTKAQ